VQRRICDRPFGCAPLGSARGRQDKWDEWRQALDCDNAGAGNQNATPTFDQHSAEEEKVGHPPSRGLDALPTIVLYFACAPGALVRKS